MSSKKMTITIDYKAGSNFQDQFLNSLVKVFMEGLSDSFLKHHKRNEINFIIENSKESK